MASDHNTAGTSLLALLHLVNLLQTFALVCSFELLGEIIIADTASIDYRVRRQDVLRVFRSVAGINPDHGERTAAPRAAFWDAPPAT